MARKPGCCMCNGGLIRGSRGGALAQQGSGGPAAGDIECLGRSIHKQVILAIFEEINSLWAHLTVIWRV